MAETNDKYGKQFYKKYHSKMFYDKENSLKT